MPTCPRCGADNKEGRRACWNCWTLLTGTAEAGPPPADPPVPTAVPTPLPPDEAPPTPPPIMPLPEEAPDLPEEQPVPPEHLPAPDDMPPPVPPPTLPETDDLLAYLAQFDTMPAKKPPASAEPAQEPVAEEAEIPDDEVFTADTTAISDVEEPAPDKLIVLDDEEPAAEAIAEPEDDVMLAEVTEILAEEAPIAEVVPVPEEAPAVEEAEASVEDVCVDPVEPPAPVEAAEAIIHDDSPDPEPLHEGKEGHDHADPAEAPTTERHDFIFPSAPAARAGVRGGNVLLLVTFLLCVLLVAAMLSWFFTSRVAPRAQAPAEVGLAYLTALSAGDVVTQPQLATRDSSGLRLPAWLTVVTAQPAGAATVRGERAALPCRLTLAPAPGEVPAPAAIVTATSLPIEIALPLLREDGAWRVDQRKFLDTLYATLVTRAETSTLPGWK